MRPRAWLIAPILPLLLLAIVAVLVPASTWTQVFTHPVRVERLGHPPESTIAAGRLVRIAWPILAIAIAVLLVSLDRVARGVSMTDSDSASGRAASGPSPSASKRSDAWIICAVTALAAVVRLPRMLESLWFDEIATLLDYAQFGPGPIVANAFTQANHTLHTLLTWLAMTAMGEVDEVILRVPTFLASLATVPAMWLLASEAVPTRRSVAILASIVTALMPVIVLSGVEARGYSMMILFATLAIALLLRAQRTGRATDAALHALCAALGVWSHLVTVCIPLAHGAIVLSRFLDPTTRRGALTMTIALMIAALTTLLLVVPMAPDLLAIRRDFLALDGNEPSLWGPEGVHALLQLGGSWAWWASLPAMVVGAFGAIAMAKSATGRVVLISGALGGGIAAILTIVGDSWLYARFLLFMMPTAALAIAIGIDRLRTTATGTALSTIASVVVAALWLTDLALRPPKQPLRDAVAMVAEARQPHERVATIGLPDNVLAYYGQGHEMTIQTTGPLGVALDQALEAIEPSWMIVLYPRSVPDSRFDRLRSAGFVEHARLDGWADWGNGQVQIWHRRH